MNYQIIGGDGQEYGPVPAETIREWIADHRLDARSQVKAAGAADWSSLGDVAEFADALAAPVESSPSPSGTVDIAACLSTAFELFGKHWLKLVAASLIWLVAAVLIAVLSAVINAPASIVFQQAAQSSSIELFTWLWAIPLYAFGTLLSTALNALLWASALRFLVKVVRGAEPDFNDLLSGFQLRQIPIALTGIAQTLLTLLGVLCCVLPGIYLTIAYIFAAPIALERNLGIWETLELGRRTVTRHWWPMFALALIGVVFILAGFALCVVGILAAYPIVGLMFAKAYHDLFDKPAEA